MTEEEIAKIQADQERQFIQKQQEMLSGQVGGGAQAPKVELLDADDEGAAQASARKEIIKILQTIKNKD